MYTFYRRKIFWGLIVEMIKRGRSVIEAIDKVYQVYGDKTSVTNVIKKLQQEKKIILIHSYERFFSCSMAFPLTV